MSNEERQPGPFNQQAALEELERFGRDIERYRAQREAIGEQFENFIRSFETPRPSPSAPVRPMPAPPQVPAPVIPASESASVIRADAAPVTPAAGAAPVAPAAEGVPVTPAAAPAPPGPAADRAPVTAAADAAPVPSAFEAAPIAPAAEVTTVTRAAEAVPTDSVVARPVVADSENAVAPAIVHDTDIAGSDVARAPDATPEAHAPVAAPVRRARSRSAMPVLVGGTLLAVFAAVLVVMTFWNRGGESAAPGAVAPETPVAAPDPTPVPATPPPATAIAPPPSASEITTIRRVWMRVTVDGQRVLEREVPAGTTVPLQAEQSIVIRTGDAGAVQLSIRGEPRGFLGAEGEVVTRTFTVPSRAPGGPAGPAGR